LKNHYELLGVAPKVPADEIKRAFRREIARYHPDKVQHLGPEFQEIAATRASELTEAYRILMDAEARAAYDEALAEGSAPAPMPSGRAQPPATAAQATEAQPQRPAEDRRFKHERATTNDFLRKAVFARLRDAVATVSEGATVSTAPGMDAVYSLKTKRGLFKKPEPPLRLLAKYVTHVNAAAIEASWSSAVSAGHPGETVCLLLLGSGVAPANELSAAVAAERRKSRRPGPVLVPVDVRDWEALFPPETPAAVRAIIRRLRDGEG
jgi:DnaJ-like protein